MIVAVDVHYTGSTARAVRFELDGWEDEAPRKINRVEIEGFSTYLPGKFYKRELPCILKVLEKSDLRKVEAIIIDGYVILDNNGKPGLGGHLFKELNENIPIIGVAKTSFRDNLKYVKELYRGLSKNPLFITSKGMTIEEATDKIRKMKGNFRIPSLLTRLDRKTKE